MNLSSIIVSFYFQTKQCDDHFVIRFSSLQIQNDDERRKMGGDRIYTSDCVIISTWLSCMSRYSEHLDRKWSFFNKCPMSSENIELSKVFSGVKWRSWNRWDIIIITYPWAEKGSLTTQFQMTLILLRLSLNWAMTMMMMASMKCRVCI